MPQPDYSDIPDSVLQQIAADKQPPPSAPNSTPVPVTASAEALEGTDGGRYGCASTVCKALNGAGIPFPDTPSAAEMESCMASHGFTRVPLGQAQVIFGRGTGPSGRHAMLGVGSGQTVEDPGGSRGTTVQRGRVPFGDPTATGWAYHGAGAAQGTPDTSQIPDSVLEQIAAGKQPAAPGVPAPQAPPPPATSAPRILPASVPVPALSANTPAPALPRPAPARHGVSLATPDDLPLAVTDQETARTILLQQAAHTQHYQNLSAQKKLTPADEAAYNQQTQRAIDALRPTGFLDTVQGQAFLHNSIQDGRYRPAPTALQNFTRQAKQFGQGIVQNLNDYGASSVNQGENYDPYFAQKNPDLAAAQKAAQARIGAQLTPDAIATGIGTDPLTTTLLNVAGRTGQAVSDLKTASHDQPFSLLMDAAPFAMDGIGSLAGRIGARGGAVADAAHPVLPPADAPAPVSVPRAFTPPRLVGAPREGALPQPKPVLVAPAAREAAGLHPTAPGVNGAERAPDGTFTPSPAPAIVPETPTNVPQVPQTGANGQSVARAQNGKYAGSINTGKLTGTPEENARIAASVQRQGLDNKPPISNADTLAASKNLGVTVDTLRTLEPGEFPPGLKTSEQGQYIAAVKNVTKAAARAANDAAQEYALDPTQENLKASVQANADEALAVQHRDMLAHNSGSNLQVHAAPDDDEFVADAADDRMRKQQALAQVPKLARAAKGEIPTAAPGKRFASASNPLVSDSDFQETVARLSQKLKRVSADPLGGLGTLADAAPELSKIALYYVERGVRKFTDFTASMRAHFPGLNDTQATQLYAQARADYAEGQKNNLKATAHLVFADALAPTMGRRGASDFINDVADGPLPDAMSKLLQNDYAGMTPQEKALINDRQIANRPQRSKGAGQSSLQALKQVQKEFADANRRAALKSRTRPAGYGAAAYPRDPLRQPLAQRIGGKNAAQYLADLDVGDTAAVTGKWRAGQELTAKEAEGAALKLERYLRDPKKPQMTDLSKALTRTAAEARAGRAARVPFDAKGYVRQQLLKLIDPKDAPAIENLTKELAAVKTDPVTGQVDGGALNELVSRHAQRTYAENIKDGLRAGFLSSPGTWLKIAGSHVLYNLAENAKRIPAKAFAGAIGKGHVVQGIDPAADLRAIRQGVVKGLPEAVTALREGTQGLQYRGLDPLHDYKPNAPLQPDYDGGIPGIPRGWQHEKLRRVVNPIVRAAGRTHGAAYHAPIVGLFDRGITEGAVVKAQSEARAEGLRGQAYRDYVRQKSQEYRTAPPRDVLEHAQGFAKEQIFLNDNAFHAMIQGGETIGKAASTKNSGLAGIGQAADVVKGYAAPFVKVPSNVAGKIYEYSPAGAVDSTLRALYAKAMRHELTDHEAQILSNRFGRGIVGTAGVAAGYALYKHHLLTAPNPKAGDYGSVNIPKGIPLVGGKKLPVSQFQPVINGPLSGAAWAQAAEQGKSGPLAFAMQQTRGFGEVPLTRLAEAQTAITSGTEGEWKRAIGQLLASNVPAAVSFIARITDPLPSRRKAEILDYVKYQIPRLRETLPPSGGGMGGLGTLSGGLGSLGK